MAQKTITKRIRSRTQKQTQKFVGPAGFYASHNYRFCAMKNLIDYLQNTGLKRLANNSVGYKRVKQFLRKKNRR